MAAIRGVVFDFGGVISAAQVTSFWEDATALTGLTKEDILAGWRKHRWMFDSDFITPQGLYYLIGADHGKTFSGKDLDTLGQWDYDSWATPNPATFEWAKELKQAGYKIGILTNMPTSFIPWFDRCAAGFRALADAEVISGAEHIVKPNPAIYALMAQRLNLNPEELCFFDDTLANVTAAKQCGWSAIHFANVEQARAEFAALLA